MPEGSIIPFHEKYLLKEELGKGAFAVVHRCINSKTKKEYAAKIFTKEKLTKRDLYKIDNEISICKKLCHSNIVHLHEVMSDSKHYFLVFDLITGGELFEDLVSREGLYTEAVTAKCMYQLFDTVAYIHMLGIVHRDLKPENILLESKERKVLKIADFGLAIEVEKDETTKWYGKAGTLHYMAPEMLELKPYGRPVDCWACGVIMYILLSGFLPFHHKDERKLNLLITHGDYDMQHKTWSTVTGEGKDLVQKLLCVVPSRRLTADQALKHPWFKKIKSSEGNLVIRSDTIEYLKEFNARRKLKGAIQSSMFIFSFLSLKKKEPNKSNGSMTHSSHSTVGTEKSKVNSGNRSKKK